MQAWAAVVGKDSPAPDQGRTSFLCSCLEGRGTRAGPIRGGRRKEAGKSISCPSSSSRTVARNSFAGFVETTGGTEPPAVFAPKLWPAQQHIPMFLLSLISSITVFSLYFFKEKYLFIWLCRVLAAVCELLAGALGI